MKTQRFLPIVLAGFVLMLLNACATYPKSGQSALTGNWTNSLGTVWTIKADGNFDVDLTHHGKRDVWGTCMVSGDTVTLHELGGKVPKGCKGDATYKFSRPDKNSLQFTLVKDSCKLRKENVLAVWKTK